jgi:predicted TIM-barrel fold metal-dependent hydrolase
LYVTYEEREDLEYLMRYVGEDNLIVGSDWGHHGRREKGGDPSGQPAVFSNMKSQHEISANLVEKILVDNPRRFYGL